MARRKDGGDVGALGLEAALHAGTTAEMLDALRLVLALVVIAVKDDPDRRNVSSLPGLSRAMLEVEARQAALRAPESMSRVDELRARREGAAGRGA